MKETKAVILGTKHPKIPRFGYVWTRVSEGGDSERADVEGLFWGKRTVLVEVVLHV